MPFCRYCGKELNAGEVCACRQQPAPPQSPQTYAPQPGQVVYVQTAVTKISTGGIIGMIVGILLMLGGAGSLIYGIMSNADLINRARSFFTGANKNPGTVFIIIGIVALVIGLIVTIIAATRKKRIY